MPHPSLRVLLTRHYQAVVRALAARHIVRVLAIVVVAASIVVLAGLALPPVPATAWTRLLLLVGAALAALALGAFAFRRALPRFDGWLESVEERFPGVRSWLRNALDLEGHRGDWSSAELSEALTRETARRLDEVPLHTMRPALEARRPLRIAAVALGLVLVAAVLLPVRMSRSWTTLWNPGSAAPPVRLVVEPGSVKVTPGAALTVRARVWGSTQRPRILRSAGLAPVAAAEGDGGDGARLWRFDLSQLTRAQNYRVRVAGVESPAYDIALAGEPQAVSFEIEYVAPAYARLPVQRGTATRGDLSALRGTEARVEALFDRDLDHVDAKLADGARARWTAVTPRRWRGTVPIASEGEYELTAVAPGGRSRFRYRVTPVPDAPPVIVVRTPQGDLDLPAGQQVPLEVLGQDDLGLQELNLEYRKDPTAPWTRVPLARFPGRPREAQVENRWDASSLALLPGESASFRFELVDDNTVSGPGRAVSPVYELRFPSLTELYDKIDDHQGDAQKALEKMADQTRELQKTLDKLSREQHPAPSESPSFERSEEMKSALERQQQISKQVEQSAAQLKESLEMASERQAFDQQLQRKLQEISKLVDQIQSPEFKDALRKMQQALEKMNTSELERRLPQWREQNQEMMKNLERTAELLKQLREEEKLASLAQRAEELKAQQDALNREHEAAADRKNTPAQDQKSLADKQENAAKESEQLAKETHDLAQDNQNQQEQASLDSAATTMSQEAAPKQHEASESASQSQSQKARQSGQQASESLDKAAQQLNRMSAQQQSEQDNVDLASVRRAAQDLNSIQREAQNNMESPDSPDRADRQSDLAEGVARVADSLHTLAQKTPFIQPKLSEALGRAMNQLQTSARQLDQGNKPGGESAGRSASEALNDAVNQLRQSESSMCQNPGNGQKGKQPHPGGGSMREMAGRQERLNQQSQRLVQHMTEQVRMQTGDQAELRRLAEEQARIREQVGQLAQDQEAQKRMLGRLDDAQKEMKDVEEALRNGATDPDLEQKQQHILSRLLDADRSLNRQDFDPQRESRPGEDIARRSPAELPADLLRENDRLRLDLLKADADRYPAQYRAFVEAYLRSLNGAPANGSSLNGSRR